MKRRSTALQAKFVADGVVDTLRRCGSGGVQFVCCLLTNQPTDTGDDVNVPLLRSQVYSALYVLLFMVQIKSEDSLCQSLHLILIEIPLTRSSHTRSCLIISDTHTKRIG